MEKTEYNKPWLYREIAKRGHFNIYDIKNVLYWFSFVIQERIYFKGQELKSQKDKDTIEVIRISGLFTLYLKKIAPHSGWNALKDERIELPESYKIVITPSRSLLNLLRDGIVDDNEDDLYDDDFEEELE